MRLDYATTNRKHVHAVKKIAGGAKECRGCVEKKEIKLAGAKLLIVVILREHTVFICINQGVEYIHIFTNKDNKFLIIRT